MTEITQVDIYWEGPGWYVWLVVRVERRESTGTNTVTWPR